MKKKTTRIGQPEGRRLSSRQCTTSYFFEDAGKIERARLGCFTFRHHFRGKNFESEEGLKISLLQFFNQKDQKFFIERWKIEIEILKNWLKDGKMWEQMENI